MTDRRFKRDTDCANENRRRRLSIAGKLATWAGAMPRLIRRVAEVLKLSYITEAQTVDIELIAGAGRDGVDGHRGRGRC